MARENVLQGHPEAVASAFKAGLRRLATTVSLVTVNQDGGWGGMAATAVMPMCAEPPTLLVAVNRSASIHPFISERRHFCVNLLAQRHAELVSIFSGGAKGADRFKTGNWENGPGGLPILTDALARFICRTQTMVDVGSHTLLTALVEDVDMQGEVHPLLWIDGDLGAVMVASKVITS
ncbi:flavin reductase family protein [Sphingobium aromaticiconvertens]|uniref:flavin reductase family protein n=1 Tax=Sphingobium aromaticiconvertens TaxID=365341 RepID=UPI003016DD00